MNHTCIVTGSVSNGKTQIDGCDFHVNYNDAGHQPKREFEGPHQCRSAYYSQQINICMKIHFK